MAIKLIKACKDLNVAVPTAAEFANKHGKNLKVDDPNQRIDDETYYLLAKEFNKDMALKMEADKRKQELADRVKPQTISIEPAPKEEPVVARPKVVGKIDLDPKPAPAPVEGPKKEEPKAEEKPIQKPVEASVSEVKEQPKEQPKVEEKPVVVVPPTQAEPQVEVAQPQKAKAEPKVEPKKEDAVPKKPTHKDAKAEPQTPQNKAVAESKKETPAPVQNQEQQPQQPEKKEPEVFTLHKTEARKPVVVGTIDLDKLNQATHPKTKTKEQKKKEREERQRQGNATPNNAGAANANANASADSKRKRERVRGNKVDINNPDFRKGGKNPKIKKPVQPVVDDQEVQKQIKETIARLQSGKGKNTGVKYRKEKREHARAQQEEILEQEQSQSKVLKLTEFVTANELATMMNISVNQVIGTCMSLGLMVSINQRLDAETINIVAEEFGFTTEFVSAKVVAELQEDESEYSDEDLVSRPPIVTVMGHVDHGKTSLLDHIRNTNVIAGEAGGITQHIGAYNVKLKNGQHITFLDTPGHEAFTAMRARGAKVTDIAIIIVAADDAVMPQTIEAINHAQAAGVPMIFAINKCDKPGANPDKIKEQLSAMNILVEEWGGKYQSQDISAKKGDGVFELLEKVLLEAEMLDLKANPKRRAKGSIIESSLDKGRGYVATILVQDGTLHIGDVVLAGTAHGKVKAMFNERNQRIKEVHPGEPALILGLNGAPGAGDDIVVVPTEQEAREIASKREQLQREQSIRTKKHVGLEEIGRRLAIGDFKELNLIVKGDVDGSVEALSDSLLKLSTENIQVNVIHKAVGAISDSDILLAEASDAIIIGFQVRPTATARKLADKEEIDIRLYSIIYDAIEEVKQAMAGMLAPEVKEEITATLEVRQTFRITKVGTVAGCIVKEGKIKRGNKVRVIRDGIVIHTGELNSLKREKDDVKEVGLNTECGVNLRSYNDIQEGDVIESFEQIEVQKDL